MIDHVQAVASYEQFFFQSSDLSILTITNYKVIDKVSLEDTVQRMGGVQCLKCSCPRDADAEGSTTLFFYPRVLPPKLLQISVPYKAKIFGNVKLKHYFIDM